MFNFFRKKTSLPAEPVPVLETVNAVPGLIVPGNVLLKPKKWVTVQGKVGIVTAVDTSGYVTVDLVNGQGYTTSSVRVPVGQISLAKYQEIPANRRGDPVLAATKGYV